jgi:hypothetical protein
MTLLVHTAMDPSALVQPMRQRGVVGALRVGPRDPVVPGLVVALLTVVAAVASLVPARRAMQIDPITSLRSQ